MLKGSGRFDEESLWPSAHGIVGFSACSEGSKATKYQVSGSR